MKAPLNWFKFTLLLSILTLAGLRPSFPVEAQSTPVVQAVLFYRSTCSHCIQLVSQVLPPIVEKYGDRLQIYYCDVSYPAGDALFTSAIDSFSIKTIGVPTIVVGTQVLIGSINIEEQFPGIIDAGLANAGLGWPTIPGLEAAFFTAGSMQMPDLTIMPGPSDLLPVPAGTSAQAATSPPQEVPVTIITAQPATGNLFIRNFEQDPRGNSLAVIILIGLIVSALYGFIAFIKGIAPAAVGAGYPPPLPHGDVSVPVHGLQAGGITPMISVLGTGISAYLAYVEISLADAICGPVGNCNVVQSSSYARLFGILPIGVLGLVGYFAILIAWMFARSSRDSLARAAGLALFGLTAVGLLFSIYLTFLEPFVIGASCLWCLASAVLMAALFLLNASPPGRKNVT